MVGGDELLVHVRSMIRILVAAILVLKALWVLLVRQVEACPIGHVHLEAGLGEALGLLLLDAVDLLLRMAHTSASVVLL